MLIFDFYFIFTTYIDKENPLAEKGKQSRQNKKTKIMKIRLTLFLLTIIVYSAFSQKGIGHVTLLKKNEGVPVATTNAGRTDGIGHVTLLKKNAAMIIYLGGGISNPSTTTKEAGIVNGIDINLSVYKPIWAWEQSNISLGINAGGGYTTGNGDYALDGRYTVYNLQGQSAPPMVSERGSGSPKAQGFKFEAGPQMNIHLGDVTVSPIFNVGYMNIEQKALTVTETVQENTVDYPYDLLTQKATKTSGLGIIPKVRLAYNITSTIGLWVEGSYTMGSKIAAESTRFVMDPTIPSDSYNLGHFQEGQYVTTKTETKYSTMGVSGGIVIALRKKGGNKSPKIQCPCCNHFISENVMDGHKPACCQTRGGNRVPITKAPVTNTDADTPTTNGLIKPNGTHSNWREHWENSASSCYPNGIYCIRRLGNLTEISSSTLAEDETINETTTEVKGNNIRITTIAVKGKVSEETLKMFKDKKVEPVVTVLPNDLMEVLFKTINLKLPKENIIFTPANQRYEVVSTTNEGNPVQIIEVYQKTKINIDGKEYNLTVITTSGKGAGSPKNQGF